MLPILGGVPGSARRSGRCAGTGGQPLPQAEQHWGTSRDVHLQVERNQSIKYTSLGINQSINPTSLGCNQTIP